MGENGKGTESERGKGVKIKVSKGLLEAIGFMSIPSVALLPISAPLAVLYAIGYGALMRLPSDELVEIELNPLQGIAREAAIKQAEDYLHGLRQAANYGMPEQKARAKATLNHLRSATYE